MPAFRNNRDVVFGQHFESKDITTQLVWTRNVIGSLSRRDYLSTPAQCNSWPEVHCTNMCVSDVIALTCTRWAGCTCRSLDDIPPCK